MINQTVWRPDTCACSITYEWDTDVKQEERTHTVVDSNPCDIHADAGDHDAVYTAVITENQAKNNAWADISKAIPRLYDTAFSFSYDKDRNLIVAVDGLTPEESVLVTDTLSVNHPDVVLNYGENLTR